MVVKEVHLRDLIFKHASNLSMWRQDGHPNNIGICLQIPTHLLGRFNTLNRHGFALKRKYGSGLKRHVRFDDSELDLIMDVKLPSDDSWFQVDHQFALEEVRANRKNTSARGRLSSLNGVDERPDRPADNAPRSAPPSGTSDPMLTGANRMIIGDC